jgi:hypothetical protein
VVRAYTAADKVEVLGLEQALDGGNILPGLSLSVRELFERADAKPPQGL